MSGSRKLKRKVRGIRGRACGLTCSATAGLLGFFVALQIDQTVNAEPSKEQRTLLTVRDVSGMGGSPVPLGVQVQAPASEGALVTTHIGGLPKGSQISDGSRTAIAEIEQGLVEVTAWDLPSTTFLMPSGARGRFTLKLVVTIENGDRPLFTEAAFVVNIGENQGSIPLTPVRTVQAYVGPSQISVRTTQEAGPSDQMRSGATDPASEQTFSPPKPAAALSETTHGDAVAEALAADRKLWLEREQTRTETLTRQLVAAHEQIGELKSKVSDPEPGQADEDERRLALRLKEADLGRLLAKANELIRPGDISGARLLLERALETGSREAAFYLAQTYDPRVLKSWNVQGIPGDPDKARELYKRAHDAGLGKAKEMVDLMR